MRAIALLCVITPFACAHQSGGDGQVMTLTINPPSSTLVLQDGSSASEAFTATAMYSDGTSKDVTTDVAFTMDQALGNFAGAELTMVSAGQGTVVGSLMAGVDGAGSGGISGSAVVIAQLQGTRVDGSLPPNTPDMFGSGATEDPSRVPTIVYPSPGVIMPRNIGDFEVHWTDASSNNVWEVSLQSPYVDLKVYVPGGNGMGGGPDPSWTAFLPTEWLAAVGNSQSLTYQVRGADSTMPGSVGSAPPQSVDLSNEAMMGGIYYWTTGGSASPEGIYRHDMSSPQTPALPFATIDQFATPPSLMGPGRCIACHVLSRDGTKMAITWDGGGEPSDMVDVGSKTFQDGDPTMAGYTAPNSWDFGVFTPDATQFLSVEGGDLVVRDQATQTVLGMMTSAGWVTHPDLSPDGTMLVYSRPTVTNCDWAFGGGQIYIRTYNQATMTFGPETLLVADANNNYYPSFSPDGQWVMFNKSTDNSTLGAYNNPSATIWVVPAVLAATPPTAIELAALDTATAGLTNSWARWAPFAQTLGSTNRPMFWVTISSKRDFGVRLVGAARPQLWMTPFLPDEAAMGSDPSAPGFWLPFQNLDSSNHIAQWTQAIIQ
ncbi:MAG TPA: hypothetical protein VGL61_29915 [Kofleriaceae bacterium]|jgi:hypothetical protein